VPRSAAVKRLKRGPNERWAIAGLHPRGGVASISPSMVHAWRGVALAGAIT
jgi:hypothetical protein